MAPYTALLMHHPEHWYDDATRLGLGNELRKNVDFLFTGHEHMEDLHVEASDEGSSLIKSRAGEFARDDWQRCTFSSLILDTLHHSVTVRTYQWDPMPEGRLYVQKHERTVSGGVYPKGAAMHPLRDYVSNLLAADEPFFGSSFLEYFQFPPIRLSESIEEKVVDRCDAFDMSFLGEREFFRRVTASRVINVVGGKNSGRTTFLKYLYLSSLERGYSPVFLDGGTARGRFMSSYVSSIREQYGSMDIMLEMYRQQPDVRKLIIMDNFHQLSNRTRAHFFEESIKAAGTVILVSNQPLVLDADGCAEQALVLGDGMLTLRLGSFTKRSRDALIRRVCATKGLSDALGDEVALAITRTVAEYHYMFPLSPGFTLQYLRYALEKSDAGEVLLRCEKPFGEVYRSNVEKILSSHNPIRSIGYSPSDWYKIAIAALGRIAYSMHKSRTSNMTVMDANSVIRQHLEEFGIRGLEPRAVFSSLLDSGIMLLDNDGNISFANSNHHAFFVALDISKRLDYAVYDGVVDKEARADVARIIDEVMYGINETVLVFLSYLKESAFIPREFSARAARLVIDIDAATDFSFTKPMRQLALRMPDETDRVAVEYATDRYEEKRASELVSSRGLYDYDVSRPASVQTNIANAAKYLELSGRSLSACFVSTKQVDKELIVHQMYDTVGRIVGSIAGLFGGSFDEAVDEILEQLSKENPEENVDRKQVSWMYTGVLLGLSVGIIEQIADGMPDDKIVECVCEHEDNTRVQQLFQLALLSNHSDYVRFCDLAGRLCDDARKHGKYADELATVFVVCQYIINHPRLPKNLLDKLSDQVFGGNRRKVRNKFLYGSVKA